MTAPIAAWYPDPDDPSRARWWDGKSWTDWVHDRHPGAGARAPGHPFPGPPLDGSPSVPRETPAVPVTADERPLTSADLTPGRALASNGVEPPHPSATPEPWSPGPSESSLSVAVAVARRRSTPAEPIASPPPDSPWPSATDRPPASARVPRPAARTAPAFAPAKPEPHRPTPPAVPAPAPPRAHPNATTAPTPQRTDERPARAATVELAATGAASVDRARRAPDAVPGPPAGVDETPPTERARSGRGGTLRAALLVAVVIATGTVGVGLYSRGTFDELIGRGGRQPSSDAVTVYSGEGYTIEAPSGWEQQEALGDVDLAFVAPNGDSVELSSSDNELIAAVDWSDPAARTGLFDTLIGILQANNPQARVLARAPTTVDGAAGEMQTVADTRPAEPLQTNGYYFARGGRFYVIKLTSAASAADATVTSDFERIVASFRFDEAE